MLDKKTLSERDICTKYITPAIEQAGWDRHTQYLEEVSFTNGKIYVKGKMTARGKSKRANYILYYKPNIPIAILEAKDNKHSVRAGMQQALDYTQILDIPCAFSSNGDGFLFHNRTVTDERIEQELPLDEFPTPDQLWEVYKQYKGITTEEQERIALQDYFLDGSGRKPRYYQQIAVNRTVEAIARGQNRILLVMATGTGKTYTAFQIVYRLWKAGVKKRILFLADRNALIDQTRRGDFKHLQDVMTVVQNHTVDKSYEVYLALYQAKVARGFRFLRDPQFVASSLFVKKPERVEALLFIMTLWLTVYAALEYKLRQQLEQQQETLPNQLGKPTKKPTMR